MTARVASSSSAFLLLWYRSQRDEGVFTEGESGLGVIHPAPRLVSKGAELAMLVPRQNGLSRDQISVSPAVPALSSSSASYTEDSD